MATVYYEDEDDVQYQGGQFTEFMDQPEYVNPLEIGVPAYSELEEGEENEHLRAEDMWGTKKITFVMSVQGSLKDFAANPTKAVFKLPPEAHQFLQRVPSQRNRTKASKEERAGDLTRGIILKSTVTAVKNEFPIDIGVDIPGLVPEQLTSTGRHNYVLPAHTPATVGIREDISTPDNVFTEWMYENWKMCTPEDLEREVIYADPKDPNDNPDMAHVKIKGMIWPTIVKFVEKGVFQGYEDEIYRAQLQAEQNPKLSQLMTVPVEMVQKVKEHLAEPLKDIDKAFVDLTKLNARFSRCDGEPWDSHSALVGEALSVGDDEGEFAAHQMATPYTALCKVEMEFVTHSRE